MSSTTSVDFKMNPVEWPSGQTNYVLAVSGVVTTSYEFAASLTIEDSSSPKNSWPCNIAPVSGFTGFPAQIITMQNVTFPITISGSTTNNSSSAVQSTSNQHGIGSKGNNGVPVCYQVSNFVNDGGSDNDFNDFVINFQLFCSSTD